MSLIVVRAPWSSDGCASDKVVQRTCVHIGWDSAPHAALYFLPQIGGPLDVARRSRAVSVRRLAGGIGTGVGASARAGRLAARGGCAGRDGRDEQEGARRA